MTMARHQFTVTDSAGNIVPNVIVEVRHEASGQPLAVLKSDRDGAVAMSNPFTTGSDGFAAFHVGGGAYNIRAYLGPSGAPTWEAEPWRYVPIGLISESDSAGDLLSANNGSDFADKAATRINLGIFDFDSRADAVAATISAAQNVVRTAGYAAFGDGGHAMYARVAVQPTHAGKLQSADGAWWELTDSQPNLFQFGGATAAADNATALQNLIDYCASKKSPANIPAGNFTVLSTITIDADVGIIRGAGRSNSTIAAGSSFAQIFLFTSLAIGTSVQELTLSTSGTTTRPVKVEQDSVAVSFDLCSFYGDSADALIYSNGQNIVVERCGFSTGASTIYALILDCYNQNTAFSGNIVYGTGRGIQIIDTLTPGLNRVEGTRIVNNFFINTGPTNIEVHNSLLTTIVGNVVDQTSLYGLQIMAGADNVTANGNYFGSNNSAGTHAIQIDATAGSGHVINGNVIAFSDYGIVISASGAQRVSRVTISNNSFASIASNALLLDSVLNCKIIGNTDASTPASGSWNTQGTFGAGSYSFDNNGWYTVAPALFHTGSTYRFGNDTGIVGRNRGANSPGVAATSLVISHGLFRTPTKINANVSGLLEATGIFTIGASTFVAAWTTNTNATVMWDAEV